MDDQRYKQRVTIGLILLGALFVVLGFLPAGEWLAAAMRMIA